MKLGKSWKTMSEEQKVKFNQKFDDLLEETIGHCWEKEISSA
jgi:hypothetical protein